LLPIGVEQIEWPKDIIEWAGGGASLREIYEVPLNIVLNQCGGFTMGDLVDDLDSFWESEFTSFDCRAKSDDTWEIPLSQCKWKVSLHAPTETAEKD
jgi:hypothetical protein